MFVYERVMQIEICACVYVSLWGRELKGCVFYEDRFQYTKNILTFLSVLYTLYVGPCDSDNLLCLIKYAVCVWLR